MVKNMNVEATSVDVGPHSPAPSERELFADGRVRWRIYWIPQIPMEPFYNDVADYRAGCLLGDILGRYDLFQYEKNVKPDYSNMGGVQWNHPILTEGEWCDMDDDDAEYFGVLGDGDAKLSSTRLLQRAVLNNKSP